MGNCAQYMDDELRLIAIEKTLKDWGIDWILQERGGCFEGLISEIELALGTV